MDGSLHQLLPMYQRARSRGEPLVLATVVATRGSTYRKAGAQMLIAAGGHYEGLLSGGCLEGDLAGHAVSVLESGQPELVRYDHADDDDLLWGLGSGCEGGMDVWLVRLDPAAHWQPLDTLARRLEQRAPVAYGMVLESTVAELPPGACVWPSGDTPQRPPGLPPAVAAWIDAQLAAVQAVAEPRVVELATPGLRLFVAPLVLPREVLVIGGGPDARPVVEFGATLGWLMTVVDHRPAYADAARFARARRVLLARPDELPDRVDLASFDAAVIMSHHLATDRDALAMLAPTACPYVGLLGPAARRQRLLAELGPAVTTLLGSRLHAPVGLPLGGRDPASLALAIVAQIQARLHAPAPEREHRRGATDASLHVLVLAAGSASRFGAPKQLADVAGRPMLARAMDAAIALAGRDAVTVVLGAHAARLAPLVQQAAAAVAFNPHHEQGISTSIRAGLAQVPPGVRGVLISLADQVAVTAGDLRMLVARWVSQPDCIVAAQYAGTTGAPVIFPASLFAELAALQGDCGARVLLSRHAARVVALPMPSAAFDVDTPADLQAGRAVALPDGG